MSFTKGRVSNKDKSHKITPNYAIQALTNSTGIRAVTSLTQKKRTVKVNFHKRSRHLRYIRL